MSDYESDLEIILFDKKPMFCHKYLKFGRCDKEKKCTYAHYVQEIDPMQCKAGARCSNEKCSYIHAGESFEDMHKRLVASFRLEDDILKKNRSDKIQAVKNTKLCKYLGACELSKCNFAHEIKNLNPIRCKLECNKQKCPFLHNDEGLIDLCLRAELADDFYSFSKKDEGGALITMKEFDISFVVFVLESFKKSRTGRFEFVKLDYS